MATVDFIAAEDTRVTLKLLNHFGVKKPLVSYFKHNKRDHGEKILARLEAGESCALVSDAGMPAISDPGELLVAQCAERGIPVLVVPGPSAVVSALAISGLPTGRFTFEGFLSVNKKSRRDHLEEVKTERRTMVFYEAPHKLYATLRDMLDVWGDRRIAIVRELTKIHEEVVRTTLAQAVKRSKDDPFKGEIVLVIEGASAPEAAIYTLEEAVALAQEKLEQGLTPSEAAKQAAGESGLAKRDIYRAILHQGESKGYGDHEG